ARNRNSFTATVAKWNESRASAYDRTLSPLFRTTRVARRDSARVVHAHIFFGRVCRLRRVHQESRNDRDEMGLGAGDAVSRTHRTFLVCDVVQRTCPSYT